MAVFSVYTSVMLLTIICINTGGMHAFITNDATSHTTTTTTAKQIDDPIDSRDYESVDEILNKTDLFARNFDYYVASTDGPPAKTTVPQSGAAHNHDDHRSDKEAGSDGSSSGGGSIIIIVVVVVMIIGLVIVGSIGIFMFMRSGGKTKGGKGRGKRGKASRSSLTSIETVASDTGKPLRETKAAPPAPGKPPLNRKS